MAEPPQMPVPAEMRLLSFQLSPRLRPTRYPPPKQVSSVKHITISDRRPTVRMSPMLSDAPSRMMASLSTRLEVNLSPTATSSGGLRSALMPMPMNSAITDAPMRWMGKSPSRNFAAAATTAASSRPGTTLRYLLIFCIP